MDSDFSAMSSMSEKMNQEDSPGVYREGYRLALYALLNGGREAYQEFLKAEGITDFLSEDEISYILENKKFPSGDDDEEELPDGVPNAPSTYCPMESDVEVPDLDLGWPDTRLDYMETNVRMVFHPPRQNMPSIKTLVRKCIREAKMVIAIAMDIFTDVDIFRDLVEVSTRGIVVYVLLDDIQFNSFLQMTEKANVPLQKLWNVRIRTVKGQEYRCQSGARFHGALEQKFMLVDCHTVLYGSYSFMWSYEKINLSMALLITGRLVSCYDEEFRRLFARSIIPALLTQQTTSSTDLYSTRTPGPNYSLHSTQFLERSRTFDHSQLKTIRGRLNTLKPEEETPANGAAIRHGLNFPRNATTDQVKQGNTYASLQTRMYSSLRQRSRVVGENGQDVLEREPFSASGQFNHQGQYRQPVQDEQPSLLSSSEMSLHKWRIDSYLKNNLIPEDSTGSLDCISTRSESKSSLLSPHSSRPNLAFKTPEQPALQSPCLGRRTITSVYSSLQRAKDNELGKDSQKPELSAECRFSIDSLSRQPHPPGQVDPSTVIQPSDSLSRQPHPPGQVDPSTVIKPSDSLSRQPYLPGQVNPSTVIKPPPQGISDHLPSLPLTNYQSVPHINQLSEAVICKPTTPDPNYSHSSERSTITKNEEVKETLKEEIQETQKLTEGHRSISHYDMQAFEDKKTPQLLDWQEPPSRTASAMHLGKDAESSMMKTSNLKRLRPFTGSSRTRLSLIEIPEEKDCLGSRRNLEDISPNTDTSTQNPTTLTKTQQAPIEANVHISGREAVYFGITSPTASCTGIDRAQQIAGPVDSRPRSPTWSTSSDAEAVRNVAVDSRPMSPTWGTSTNAEATRYVAASPRTLSSLDVMHHAHHRVDHGSMSSVATVESVMSNPGEGRYGIPEVKRNKVYSRFEQFLSVERKTPDRTETDRMITYAAEKRRNMFMGPSTTYSRYQTQPQPDNRFGKFMQRVGSLINKNK